MNSRARDRKDLAWVVETLLSNPARGPSQPAPEKGDEVDDAASGRETPVVSGRLELVTAVSCGAPERAPLFLLAVAALPSPAPRTVALSFRGDEAEWLEPMHSEAPLSDEFEHGGGRIVVLLPPRDGPEVRALALAGPTHLVWVGPRPSAVTELRDFLDALHFGCDGSRVGWLTTPDQDTTWVRRFFDEWTAEGTRRNAASLGSWRPGQPLPSSVCGFLAAAPRAEASVLSFAWNLLRRASLRPKGAF